MTHPDHNLLAAIAAAPAAPTPEATEVKAENLSAAGAFPATELPILRDGDSAIDRALRGRYFIPTF